jgi:hypothetical protein
MGRWRGGTESAVIRPRPLGYHWQLSWPLSAAGKRGSTVRKIWFATLLLALLAGIHGVAAQQIRLPAKGLPAFELAVPPGWSPTIDQKQNLSIYNPSRTVVLRLTMLEDDDIATSNYVDVATLYFKMISAEPSTESVPV